LAIFVIYIKSIEGKIMSVIYVFIKATSTQPGGIVLVEASPAAVKAIAELGQPAALELKTIVDTTGNAQSAVDYLKAGIGNDLAATIKTIGSVAAGLAVGEAVAIGVAAGIAAFVALPYALLIGAFIGVTVGGAAGQKIYEDGWDAAYRFGQAISEILGTTPDPLVKTIRYVDPLILDLDGDGLEITPLSRGILFDANGDLIKTATAWAGADDGMLVWDRNGNGLIDSGRELFGDETILANGPNAGKKAANGFAALADLDSNLNGKFDALDSQYANLRIWRDLNQDGISQANELQSLQATGVQSIILTSSSANTNYGDAILAQSGSYTRVDAAGATSTGQAGSFILAQNSFVRQFVPITVSAEASTLPNIAGSGWVRDLQEAATQSPELIGLLHTVQNASTRAGYKDAVATLLRAWGNDSGYNSASDQALANGYGLILSDPLDAQEAGWMDVAIKGSDAARDSFRAALSASELTKFDAMRERMVGGLERVHAFEDKACVNRLRRNRRARSQLRISPVVATIDCHEICSNSISIARLLANRRGLMERVCAL
jgi:hypothetical protein